MDEDAIREQSRQARKRILDYCDGAVEDIYIIRRLVDLEDDDKVTDDESRKIVADALASSRNIVINYTNLSRVLEKLLIMGEFYKGLNKEE